MSLNKESGKFYEKQPGEFLRGTIYPSLEFFYENVDKNICGSSKINTPTKNVNTMSFDDMFEDPQFILYGNALFDALSKKLNS